MKINFTSLVYKGYAVRKLYYYVLVFLVVGRGGVSGIVVNVIASWHIPHIPPISSRSL